MRVADLAECTILPVSATTLAAPRGIPGLSLPSALSAFLGAGNACDFVVAMTKRYGENWRISHSLPLSLRSTRVRLTARS